MAPRDLINPGAAGASIRLSADEPALTTRVAFDAHKVAEVLGSTGTWCLVEGVVLDEAVYPYPGVRWCADLDLLAEPAFLEQAWTLLEAAGAVLIDRNLPLACQQGRGELDVRMLSGGVVDMHWHLVKEVRTRSDLRVSSSAVLARRVPVRIGAASAWRLELVDALIHVAVHAVLSGAHRAVWAMDSKYSLDEVGRRWSEVGRRAGRLAPLVDLAIRRAAPVAGVDVPPRLGRRTLWTAAFERWSRCHPMGQTDGRTGRLLFASTRTTTARGLVALLRAWPAERRPGPTKDDLILPRDSPQERREFLDWVARPAQDGRQSRWGCSTGWRR